MALDQRILEILFNCMVQQMRVDVSAVGYVNHPSIIVVFSPGYQRLIALQGGDLSELVW